MVRLRCKSHFDFCTFQSAAKTSIVLYSGTIAGARKSPPEDEFYANVRARANEKSGLSIDGLPGPGWTMSTFRSGKNMNRKLWVSPELNIEFDSSTTAFLFQEFCSTFSGERDSLKKYVGWRKSCGQRHGVKNVKEHYEDIEPFAAAAGTGNVNNSSTGKKGDVGECWYCREPGCK